MPERTWDVVLNPLGDRLWVRFVTERGRVTHYVVRYEAMIEGRAMQVVRCDSAHNHGHCDLLGWDGETVRKVWGREGLGFDDTLTEALADLQENWERYRTAFLRRRP